MSFIVKKMNLLCLSSLNFRVESVKETMYEVIGIAQMNGMKIWVKLLATGTYI